MLVAATGQAAAQTRKESGIAQVKHAICVTFGSYCSQALRVSYCETGGTYSVWAGYGKHQYWGLFQMGSKERAKYGHSWDAWGQSKAAYKYFVATHYSWGPWTCKP